MFLRTLVGWSARASRPFPRRPWRHPEGREYPPFSPAHTVSAELVGVEVGCPRPQKKTRSRRAKGGDTERRLSVDRRRGWRPRRGQLARCVKIQPVMLEHVQHHQTVIGPPWKPAVRIPAAQQPRTDRGGIAVQLTTRPTPIARPTITVAFLEHGPAIAALVHDHVHRLLLAVHQVGEQGQSVPLPALRPENGSALSGGSRKGCRPYRSNLMTAPCPASPAVRATTQRGTSR